MSMVNDPIGDMLTRIRNAYHAGQEDVLVAYSKLKVALAQLLKREGYIADYRIITEQELAKGLQILDQALKRKVIFARYLKNPNYDLLETLRRRGFNLNRDSERALRVIKQLFERFFLKRPQKRGVIKQGILQVKLRYLTSNPPTPAITAVKRISKPGRHIYTEKEKIPRVMAGLGITILSTSQGLLTDTEARRKGVGGEIIAYVW